MTTVEEAAKQAQRRALDPEELVWVAASAGTGKTKVLTDRLLALMLDGTDPGAGSVPDLHPGRRGRDGQPHQPAAGRLDDDAARPAGAGPRRADRAVPARGRNRPGAPAVRPRSRSARRHQDRDDPCLLPVAAPPLPAGSRGAAGIRGDGRAQRAGGIHRGCRNRDPGRPSRARCARRAGGGAGDCRRLRARGAVLRADGRYCRRARQIARRPGQRRGRVAPPPVRPARGSAARDIGRACRGVLRPRRRRRSGVAHGCRSLGRRLAHRPAAQRDPGSLVRDRDAASRHPRPVYRRLPDR